MNTQPLHLDEVFASETEFGTRLVNSMFTLALLVGMSVTETTLGTTFTCTSMTADTLRQRRALLGDFELSTCFRFGGLPIDVAEESMELFAKKVLPEIMDW